MGAGRPEPAAVRRGRGQEGAAVVARMPWPEWGWLGQGLAPRTGWARALGMVEIGVVMVGLVMVMVGMPSLGPGALVGVWMACPFRGPAHRDGWGRGGPWPIPGSREWRGP